MINKTCFHEISVLCLKTCTLQSSASVRVTDFYQAPIPIQSELEKIYWMGTNLFVFWTQIMYFHSRISISNQIWRKVMENFVTHGHKLVTMYHVSCHVPMDETMHLIYILSQRIRKQDSASVKFVWYLLHSVLHNYIASDVLRLSQTSGRGRIRFSASVQYCPPPDICVSTALCCDHSIVWPGTGTRSPWSSPLVS